MQDDEAEPTTGEAIALDAADLEKTFGGVRALRGVSVQVRAGEVACLIGENGSGKSTFVKIVSGVHRPDSGTVSVHGQPLAGGDPREAIAAGVQVIYQDLALFDDLSVAENIAMNRLIHDGTRVVRRSRMREIARETLARVGVELDLDVPISSVSFANRQIVAICRALSMNARVLFMDEPTTALTTKEVRRLLRIVAELKELGLAIVFISHKLDEVMEVADSVTVFRDGSKVGDFAADQMDTGQLTYHMTGHEVVHEPYVRSQDDDTPILELDELTRAGHYENISLSVRPGDIVGVTGLLGSGRTEVALSLFGLNPADSGTVRIDGKQVEITSPIMAMKLGIALLPESRQEQGLFMGYSAERNISAAQLDRVTTAPGILSTRRERELAREVISFMGVNNREPRTVVGNLSGGNQQKIVIGRGVSMSPKIYILDSPTVGVDIGAKAEIYARIQAMARDGMGVILISDEPEEIAANCNRVVVMHDGRIVERLDSDDVAAEDFADRLGSLITDPGQTSEGHTEARL
ncbi:sugar ABC transporter ATP-binding protein [Georgenia deserti]|uniref:Sugar ABC transporter ATP-binding protein n=1 Tax=Georgenia deserti TaxID=2093781 RepID=A0ABW4L4A4_9MICO